MGTIVHFDLPADDMERAKKFYSGLFGWKFQKAPGEMEYYLIETTDLEGKTGVGGGMGPKQPGNMGMTNYIDVDSVEECIEKVERLGGKVLMPKTTVPGFGYLALCKDTEGNTFGLWKTDESAAMH